MRSDLAPVSLQKSADTVVNPNQGDRLREFRHKDTVGFTWTEEDFVRDANPPGDGDTLISRSRLQKHQKRSSFSALTSKEQADLEAAFRLASRVQRLPHSWVDLWMDYIFRHGDRPPNLPTWQASKKAPVEPEGTTEAADRHSSRQQQLDPASLPIRSLGHYNDDSATPEDESVKRLLLRLKKLVKVTVIEDFSIGKNLAGSSDMDFGIGRTFLTRADGLRWWLKNVEQPTGRQYLIFEPEDLGDE